MKKTVLNQAWKYVLLSIIALIVLFPVIWIIMQSLKNYFDTIASPPKIIFTPIIKNFLEILSTNDFLEAFLNSLIVAVSSVAFCIVIGVPFGYVLARYRFKGSSDIGFFVFSTRMMPAIVVIIPLVKIFGMIKLLVTYFSLVLTNILLNIALVVWMVRGFVVGIPKEIEEALDRRFFIYKGILPDTIPGSPSGNSINSHPSLYVFMERAFIRAYNSRRPNSNPACVYGTHYNGYIAVSYG